MTILVSLFYNMISMKPPLILLSDILLMPLLAIILLTLSRLSVNAPKTPVINLYLETTQNSRFPYPNRTQVNVDGHGETGITKGAGELNSAMSIQNSILTVLLAVAAATSILSLFS